MVILQSILIAKTRQIYIVAITSESTQNLYLTVHLLVSEDSTSVLAVAEHGTALHTSNYEHTIPGIILRSNCVPKRRTFVQKRRERVAQFSLTKPDTH